MRVENMRDFVVVPCGSAEKTEKKKHGQNVLPGEECKVICLGTVSERREVILHPPSFLYNGYRVFFPG